MVNNNVYLRGIGLVDKNEFNSTYCGELPNDSCNYNIYSFNMNINNNLHIMGEK